VSRREDLRYKLTHSEVGTLVNLIRRLAIMVESLPEVSASPDPKDNDLLALAQAVKAELLVTGDKSHLLAGVVSSFGAFLKTGVAQRPTASLSQARDQSKKRRSALSE